MHVVGHDRNIIVWFKLLRESIGSITHVVDEVVAVGGEFAEKDGGDWGLGALKSDDAAERLRLQIRGNSPL